MSFSKSSHHQWRLSSSSSSSSSLCDRVSSLVKSASKVVESCGVDMSALHPASHPLCRLSGAAEVFLKKECNQVTGSFKVRGATFALHQLLQQERQIEQMVDDEPIGGITVVTASTGNHALAIVHAVHAYNRKNRLKFTQSRLEPLKVKLFLPSSISSSKLTTLKEMDVLIEISGETCELAEAAARQWASSRTNAFFISPYADIDVIAGQGTVGLEIVNQLQRHYGYGRSADAVASIDYVLVPVGGGGLISGIAAYVKSVWPDAQIIGTQPRGNACMKESLDANTIIQDFEGLETLSDGTAGGIEADSPTFDICRELLSDILLVEEEEILDAMRILMQHENLIAEGAAATTVASLLKYSEKFKGKRVVLVLCGRNVAFEIVRQVCNSSIPK